MTTRRMILKTGLAAIAVAGAGSAWWGMTRTPSKALAPWKLAGNRYEDPRLNALSYAILAPNPHNRQPWQIELVGTDAFNLRCDLDRRLPETDPYDRQITVGLGCFLELFRMAAAADGYRVDVSLFPDGESFPRLDGRRIAHVVMHRADAQIDKLFEAVLERRSTKEAFDTSKPVSEQTLAQLILNERFGGTVDAGEIDKFRELSWKAHEIETVTPRTMKESVDLMRFGKAEIEANPDGIDFSGAAFELMNISGMMTRENVGDPTSVSFEQGLKFFKEMLYTGMGYVWVTSPANNRVDQVTAGADWLRVNLKATQLGLAIHPLSQALQEYVEMEELYRELHSSLEIAEPARIQMFARIGYGPKQGPSPRWPLKTRLVSA